MILPRLKNRCLKHYCEGWDPLAFVPPFSSYAPASEGEIKVSAGPSEKKDVPEGFSLSLFYPTDEITRRGKKCSFSPDMGMAVPPLGSLTQSFFCLTVILLPT